MRFFYCPEFKILQYLIRRLSYEIEKQPLLTGEFPMGDKGSKDKGKREKQKEATRTPKEKRKLKREKKNSK